MNIVRDNGIRFPNKNSKQKKHYVIALCPDCNCEFETMLCNIKSGMTKRCLKCGILSTKRKNTKHGDKTKLKTNRLYTTWANMKSRCNNKNNNKYSDYGGRGISVCCEWREYKVFKEWSISNGYKENLEIDRINNDGNYEPNNCRWTTRNVNVRNTVRIRKTNTSGYRGVSKSGRKWRALIGMNGKSISIGTYNTKIEAAHAYDDYVKSNNFEHTINFKDNK